MADKDLTPDQAGAVEDLLLRYKDIGGGAYAPAVHVISDASEETSDANQLLTDIKANTDGLEGFVDGIETLLTTLGGYVDGLEALATAQNAAPSNVTSSALEKSHVIKNGPGTLYGLSGYNGAAYSQYFQLHDAAALPIDGATPILGLVVQVGAGQNFQLDFGPKGRAFASGIVVCTSSTFATKTLGANSDASWDAQYA